MKKLLSASIWVLLIAALTSCSTTHKLKSSVKNSADSTGTTLTDSSSIKKTQATEISQAQQNNAVQNELNIVFEDDDSRGFTEEQLDESPKANDYEGAEPVNKQPSPTSHQPQTYTYNIAGHLITAPQKIKSATFKNLVTNQTTALQVKNTITSDSNSLNKTQTTQKRTEQLTTVKEKTTKSFPWMQLGILMLIIAAAVYLSWRFKLLAIILPKKEKERGITINKT